MSRLTVIAAPDPIAIGKNFTVAHGSTVGSADDNAIILSSEQILAHHFHIIIEEKNLCLQTLNADEYVDVNGELIRKGPLTHGDIITVGDYILMVDIGNEGEEDKAASPVDDCLQSRIESRQKHYHNTQDILDSLQDKKNEKHHGRLLTLYKISNAISGILDLDHLLKRFIEILLEEFSADRGFIMLLDERQQLVPTAVISKHQTTNSKISRTIVDEVMSTKESVLCENIFDDTRFSAQESLIRSNIQSAMCVPLIRQDETLGLIYVDSQSRSKFSRNDLDLLTKVALQAAIVIENARFYQAHQEFNRNLLALSHATQSLSSYLREDLIIKDATECASKIFRSETSYLFLKREDSLQLVSTVGNNDALGNIAIPQSLREVAISGCPILWKDANEIPDDLLPLVATKQSMMAVPLSISEQATPDSPSMGLLFVADRQNEGEFSVEDRQLLSMLASYTAIALSNAKFYQEVKTKEEEIAKWNLELEKRVAKRTAELKSTQSQLIQSEKMAAIGLLAAGVAHEFNNIIASMYGFAQIAKKNAKYQEKLVDTVINQSQRACDITESLLSFSKQKGERLEMASVEELIEAVLRLTMTALEREGVQLVKQFANVPKTFLNPGKIQQVFINIIINARHAIEKNGTITITTSVVDEEIQISFRDTGNGIESEKLDKIFEPFYTTKGSFGGGTQPGTGIGLSLCYNIIKQHNGNITVQSKPGEGSCFTVSLPITREEPLVKDNSNTRKLIAKARSGKRILIGEQEQEVRDMLANIATEKDFEVYLVKNGSDAIDLCRKEHFHLILLDISMPGVKDDTETFAEVKRLEPNTSIILITGRAEDATLMGYVGYADGFLRKPFAADDVYNILKETDVKPAN